MGEANPAFGAEASPPQVRAGRRAGAAGDRLPADPRRAAARRQRPVEPGHLRDHLDGAAGRQADGRVRRQEHDRQGRVPADGRARAALRRDPGRPVARAGPAEAVGCSTTGSSEAAMLAGMALKRRWAARTGAGPGAPAEPGHGRQRAGVLGEVLPVLGGRAAAGPDGGRAVPPRRASAVAQCDEDTIGVVAILGSTFDGSYEPVAEIVAALDDSSGAPADVPVHVDGASGGHGRTVPRPGSGVGLPAAAGGLDQHVRAQVRPGLPRRRLGAVARPGRVARGAGLQRQLPRRRRCRRSRSTSPVPAPRSSRSTTRSSASAARATGPCTRPRATWRSTWPARSRSTEQFRLISRGDQLPVFAFTTADAVQGWDVFAGLGQLRERGWQVPAYTFPENRDGPGRAAGRVPQRVLAGPGRPAPRRTCGRRWPSWTRAAARGDLTPGAARASGTETGRVGEQRRVVVLGSTGSIGTQALDVVRHAPDRFEVVALAAGGSDVGPARRAGGRVRRAGRRGRTRGGRRTSCPSGSPALDAAIRASSPATTRRARRAATATSSSTRSPGRRAARHARRARRRPHGRAGQQGVARRRRPAGHRRAEPGQLRPVDSEHSALAQCLRGGTAGRGAQARRHGQRRPVPRPHPRRARATSRRPRRSPTRRGTWAR